MAQAGASDVVDVPTVDLHGVGAVTSVVLDPGVPILVENAADDELDMSYPEFVDELTHRTRGLIADGTLRHGL
ncbi:hypothetical protein [Curtobacterium sp. VKM Ac-1376]|uniref:hypothetical protein n=1 Tax=Curtobacterium sp. VKM Ac-1376 TaxID=123312 RepID=UPI00188C4C92|nr:hypothetical protein [Curtobacterium sp. VKM Ac-1376]MBF4616213.1 hypothetical protein [Curtobacterium sp. VKM Ac-1376]